MRLQISIRSLSKINGLNKFDSQLPVTTGFALLPRQNWEERIHLYRT